MELLARVTSRWEFSRWNVGSQQHDVTYRLSFTLVEDASLNPLKLTEEFDLEVDKETFDRYSLLQIVRFSPV
jgi:hypothetical protein